MIKKIIFFFILIFFSSNLFAKTITYDCDFLGDVPREELFQKFNIIDETREKANRKYIIAEMEKINSAHELKCKVVNTKLEILFDYTILENLPVPIDTKLPLPKKNNEENKRQSVSINTDDQENVDEPEEKPLTEEEIEEKQRKERIEKEKKEKEEADKRKREEEENLINRSKIIEQVYNKYFEPDPDSNPYLQFFSDTFTRQLNDRFQDVSYLDSNEIQSLKDQDKLKKIKSRLKTLLEELEFYFLNDFKNYREASNLCSSLAETKFEYKEKEKKSYMKICEKITSSNYNFFDNFEEQKFFENEFKTELNVFEYAKNIPQLSSQIDNRIAVIKNEIKEKKDKEKKLAEEKKKKEEKVKKAAEEKKKKEEEAKKLAEEKKKKEEEAKKLAEEKKKKEEKAKKAAEEKKKKEEEAKKLAEEERNNEKERLKKLIKELDFSKINNAINELTLNFENLKFKDVLKTNFNKELNILDKKLGNLITYEIYAEIDNISNEIKENEILNTNEKDELSKFLNNRKKEINTTDEIKEYQKDIKQIINSQDDVLQSRIADLEGQNTTYLIAIGLIILIMGGAIIYLILRRPKDDVPSQTSSIRNTSILQQEIDELKQIIRNSQQQPNVQQTPNVTQQQPQEEVRQPTEQELFTQKLQDLGQDYFDAFSDPNKIEGFKEKWQAIGLDRESRVGASTVTTLKKDNRPFERCNFWAVPIRNSYRIFGGRILRTNSVALTADDGRMARDLLTGIFDIEYGTSFQISQQGVAVMKNQIFEITTKGKITIPKT